MSQALEIFDIAQRKTPPEVVAGLPGRFNPNKPSYYDGILFRAMLGLDPDGTLSRSDFSLLAQSLKAFSEEILLFWKARTSLYVVTLGHATFGTPITLGAEKLSVELLQGPEKILEIRRTAQDGAREYKDEFKVGVDDTREDRSVTGPNLKSVLLVDGEQLIVHELTYDKGSTIKEFRWEKTVQDAAGNLPSVDTGGFYNFRRFCL